MPRPASASPRRRSELDLRFAVIDLQPEERPAPITLINPRVEQVSARGGDARGRLPLAARPIRRGDPAGKVVVSYEDIDGNPQTIEADGLLATCLQHEIDHLDGILFVDHLSALKRNMILRKMVKEKRLRKIG